MTKQLFTLDSLKAVVAVCCLALWAGCGGTGGATETRLIDPQNPHLHKITTANARDLLVEDIRVRHNESSGLYELNITFHNKGKSDVPFRYQFYWLDKDGFAMPGADKGWRRMPRPPHGPFEFKRTTQNVQVKDFKLTLEKGSE